MGNGWDDGWDDGRSNWRGRSGDIRRRDGRDFGEVDYVCRGDGNPGLPLVAVKQPDCLGEAS